MNEQEIIEMGETLKKRFEDLELREEISLNEVKELKKVVISSYGFIRILDMTIESNADTPFEIKGLIEVLRSYLSNEIDSLDIL